MEPMGLFQQKPEEQENQWVLPSEPLERSETDVLDSAPVVDPLSIGLGAEASGDLSSVLFPVAPSVPEAAATHDSAEPTSDEDPGAD
jgi:hypothetical protein